MNGSLTFPSEDRNPVGSADCGEKDTTHFSDASPEPEEDCEKEVTTHFSDASPEPEGNQKLLKSLQNSGDIEGDEERQKEIQKWEQYCQEISSKTKSIEESIAR